MPSSLWSSDIARCLPAACGGSRAIAPRAVDDPAWQRDGGELVRREAREQARLELRDEALELLALAGREVARPAAALAHQLHEAAALGWRQPFEVGLRQQGDLAGGDQLQDRQALEAWHAAGGADESVPHEAIQHPGKATTRPARARRQLRA